MKKIFFSSLFLCVNSIFSASIGDLEPSSETTPKHTLSDVLVKKVFIEKRVLNGKKLKCVDKIKIYLSPEQKEELVKKSENIFLHDGVDENNELLVFLKGKVLCNDEENLNKYSWLKKHKYFLSNSSKFNLKLKAKFYAESIYEHKMINNEVYKDLMFFDHLVEDFSFTSDRGHLKEDGSTNYESKFDSLYKN